MLEQVTSIVKLLHSIKDFFVYISKRWDITIMPSIKLVPKGQERVHRIKTKIDADYLVIYKVKILNSGEDRKYLELSIREDFGKYMSKEPFMNIPNPTIKHGFNYFEFNIQSELQPVQEITKRITYAVLLDSKGRYIRRGLTFSEANISKDSYSYKQKLTKQERGKIKNMELEIGQIGDI